MDDAHGLGRRFAPDDRDRRFSMQATVFPHPALPPRPRQRPYNLGMTLDQGATSQCVGYSCRDKLASAPFMVHVDQGPSAFEIYTGAQKVDEWPGEDYDGTSVRGGFKFLQQTGYLSSYVWAASLEDCVRFLRDGYGTLVLGTNWYDRMFTPDEHGFVSLAGPIAGGHAYHCFWAVPEREEFWCKNSWGPSWGIELHKRPGCFKLRYADFARLLSEDGEAGAGLEIKVN
jgi:hypothetical protein